MREDLNKGLGYIKIIINKDYQKILEMKLSK
jgi:hypothetical protein